MRTHKVALSLLAAVLAALVGFGVASTIAGASEGGSSTELSPEEAQVIQNRNDFFADVQANAPKPVLPQDQRDAWVEMWQDKADCMQAHGITAFPDAPATFGDGNTAAPAVADIPGTDMDTDSDAYAEAERNCPFDRSKLSEQAFLKAWADLGYAIPGQ